MDSTTKEISYEENLYLLVMYEILDSVCRPHYHQYPNDIKEKVDDLLMTLDKYIYHPQKGYSVEKQDYFTKITYRKMDN